jgi:hypothetical protein
LEEKYEEMAWKNISVARTRRRIENSFILRNTPPENLKDFCSATRVHEQERKKNKKKKESFLSATDF